MMSIIIPALLIQTVGAYLYFLHPASAAYAPVVYALTKATLLFLPLVLLALGYRFGPFLPRRQATSALASGLLFSIGVSILIFGLAILFKNYFRSFTPDLVAATARLGISNAFVPFAIGLSLFHSLFEEYYWRWFVFGGLTKTLPFARAAIISSVAFSAHHFIVLSTVFPAWLTIVCGLSIAAGGFFWCWLYRRYGNLWGNWLSHALLDAVIMAVAYRFMQ